MTLQLSLASGAPESIDTPCVIVGVYTNGVLSTAAAAIDAASGGALKRRIDGGDISGKPGTVHTLYDLSGVKAERVMTVGLGVQAEFDASRFQQACRAAGKAASALSVGSAATWLSALDVPGKDAAWCVRTAALAFDHAAYRYTATFQAGPDAKDTKLKSLALAGEGQDTALAQAAGMAEGVRFARHLGNMPPNICVPAWIAEQATEFAHAHDGVEIEVLEREQMEALGMHSLLAVARGSANPPRLIVLKWNGGKDGDKPYAFVGKGVTFDAGGLNIKPTGSMEEMKFDMCGAAGVLGGFVAAVKMKLPLNLVCVVPSVENMTDGNAYRPSDVLNTMSGQTVEVLNTDAEGRLILCDALTYVQRFEPQAIVDAATLTGACVIALGSHATGLMSKHDDLAEELLAAGEQTLDRAWRLPLWNEYQKQLESAFADFANIGGRPAGAITAGCFLSRFVEGQRWAHLDIAGTAWESGRKGLASGRPVSLLAQWLIDRCA
ncbi:leucyl aminopeptidase [Oleiagrimonas soli]|uniref:Probable cytosol aminopeptidase n=1 Tax=Oleiagrimonas soli TaxID=1543381 RepID=A0A099CY99_9GAMM|nr:leucyl aminopeptidase [Oleiagrimonas soli]KGI78552.1 cytosol aminopeptidase [Oleiagrimonas soli]MBB6184172.1 leucyl aminopeptidase [Oleiagrimonas soli]